MATCSSILARIIQWAEEPGELEEHGGLQSMGSQRVRHDGATEQRSSRWLIKAVAGS